MTAIARPRLAWRAARDGIGHAVSGRQPRALCGATAVDERLAWPMRERCATCRRLSEEGSDRTTRATNA